MKFLKAILFVGLLFSIGNNLQAQDVYITSTGEKYHKGSCHYLKNSKKKISLEVAIERGFTACSVCKPVKNGNPRVSGSTNNFVQTPQRTAPKTTATQCTGRTKSGARCKRMTKNANGRCHQH